ncbi:hypothetical protein LY76DRAFT_589876 [Colletotrichum caudatum]|nr:hypothetical protein LY76DRAFT_589876 [Colletotrichum caudatum]
MSISQSQSSPGMLSGGRGGQRRSSLEYSRPFDKTAFSGYGTESQSRPTRRFDARTPYTGRQQTDKTARATISMASLDCLGLLQGFSHPPMPRSSRQAFSNSAAVHQFFAKIKARKKRENSLQSSVHMPCAPPSFFLFPLPFIPTRSLCMEVYRTPPPLILRTRRLFPSNEAA